MNIILKNPYRTVGLLVGASAKEQDRQIRRLKQFIEAEQAPQDDFSFPAIGNIQRSIEIVEEAASKLNLDSDKINAALFWFYSGNAITDEPAFDAIKEGDLDQVVNIWSKLTSSLEVTQRNASAFHNLSTLYLSGILNGTNSNEIILEHGISLKLKFLESEFVKEFKSLATDETFKITQKELQLTFLYHIHTEIDKSGVLTTNNFIEIVNKQDFSGKADFFKSFVQKPIEHIEKHILESKSNRKSNKSNSINIGIVLFKQTFESLKQLKDILGISDLKFSSISDKVSDEVLQCGIDYFTLYKDTNTDPSVASMDLFHKANALAIGTIAKQRCKENTESLQEWIDDKPEREKQGKVITDLEILKKLIDSYEKKEESVSNALQLLSTARPYLTNIKMILGANDEFYLGLSSRIASDAQGMCVSEINKLQERFGSSYDNAAKLATLILLKEKVNAAWDVANIIGAMDLRLDFRNRYNQNKTALSGLRTQFANINTGSSGSSGKVGCYIATMAYGDYNHPQVIILRQFRDEKLIKSTIGRFFIEFYYLFSPTIVKIFAPFRNLNILIRYLLDLFIKYFL